LHKIQLTICGCFLISLLTLPAAMAQSSSGASGKVEPGNAGASPPSSPTGKPLQGLFYGTALESGKLKKIETRITRKSSDGKLQGEYTLHQPHGKSIPGRITEQQPLKNHHVIFKWKDSSGSGTVNMIFDNTGSAFKGRWSTDDGSVKDLPWDGHRLNASANWAGINVL